MKRMSFVSLGDLRGSTPYLGRAEDLVVVREVEIINLVQKEVRELKGYSAWVPVSIAKEFDIYGPVYNLPGYYEKKKIKVEGREKEREWCIRDFNFHPCMYAEPQEIGLSEDLLPLKTFYDFDKKLPVFFILMEDKNGDMGKE